MNNVMLQTETELPSECQSVIELLKAPIADQKEVMRALNCCWKAIESFNGSQVTLSYPYRATITLIRAYRGIASSDDVEYFVFFMTNWLDELEAKRIFQNAIAAEHKKH